MLKLIKNCLALAVCFALAAPTTARAFTHGVAVAANYLCLQGTYSNPNGTSDGCPGAPLGTPDNITLFQRPTFFSGYSQQSGQVNPYPVRPPWNVAGVDYPVGIPVAVAATLKDPATYGSTAWAALGCTYSATGNSIGGPYLACNLLSTSTGVYDIEGFDFSGSLNGHTGGCVAIAFNTSLEIIFKNNYFAVNSSCFGNSNPSGGAVQIVTSNPTTLDVENNVFDYSPVWAGAGYKPFSVGALASATFKYNVFHNIPENPINGSAANFSLLMEYNFIDSYTFAGTPNQNHGEITNLNGAGTRPQYYWFFNTIMHSNLSAHGTGTANIWVSAATSNGSVFTDNQVRNNSIVDNCEAAYVISGGTCPGTAGVTSASLVDFQSNTFTNSAVTDNYDDDIGAIYMGLANGAVCTNPVTWSGNYDLRGGAIVSKASGFASAGGSSGC